jgi:hypothetical protein
MQENLFDENKPNDLKSHWVDMPEFFQEKKTSYAKIIFRFEDEKSLQDFEKLIGQKLTKKTKSAWYPFKPHRNQLYFKWGEE